MQFPLAVSRHYVVEFKAIFELGVVNKAPLRKLYYLPGLLPYLLPHVPSRARFKVRYPGTFDR